MKLRYAVRFPSLTGRKIRMSPELEDLSDLDDQVDHVGVVDALPCLVSELNELIRFKTATLTDIGFQRIGVWNEETTAQKIEHFGLMFGALAASPSGELQGHGVPLGKLSFAMLIFPRVWDWYANGVSGGAAFSRAGNAICCAMPWRWSAMKQDGCVSIRSLFRASCR